VAICYLQIEVDFVRIESTGETMVAAENLGRDFRENKGRETYGAADRTSAPSASD
jgi:hypothetical protein